MTRTRDGEGRNIVVYCDDATGEFHPFNPLVRNLRHTKLLLPRRRSYVVF